MAALFRYAQGAPGNGIDGYGSPRPSASLSPSITTPAESSRAHAGIGGVGGGSSGRGIPMTPLPMSGGTPRDDPDPARFPSDLTCSMATIALRVRLLGGEHAD